MLIILDSIQIKTNLIFIDLELFKNYYIPLLSFLFVYKKATNKFIRSKKLNIKYIKVIDFLSINSKPKITTTFNIFSPLKQNITININLSNLKPNSLYFRLKQKKT